MTPSARSVRYLRERGWIVANVEKWIPQTKRRLDVFGFADLLAANAELPELKLEGSVLHVPGTIALVQVTSGSNHDARKDKILAEPLAQKWKDAGGVILLHSWAKRGPRGKRKLWTLREETL